MTFFSGDLTFLIPIINIKKLSNVVALWSSSFPKKNFALYFGWTKKRSSISAKSAALP